jgi:hypothetical protein
MHLNTFFFKNLPVGFTILLKGSMAQKSLRTPNVEGIVYGAVVE